MSDSLLPAAVAVLKADISDFQTKMQKATGQFDAVASKKGNLEALATVGKAAFLGLSAAAIGFGADAVKVGVAQQEANARLTTSLHDVGSSMTALSKPVEDSESAMRKFGFTNGDTTDSLAKLTAATKNPTKALHDESLAADVARGRHIDLASATDLLVKVETGHVALLSRIGIDTKDASGATISQAEALKRLSDMYGGQASAYAGTFAGKMSVLRAEVENLQERIGMALIPRIEALASAGSSSLDWMGKHATAAKVLGAAVGGPLVLAMGAYAAAQARNVFLTGLEVAGKLPQMFLTLGAAIRGTTAADVVLNETMMATQGTMLLGVAGAAGLAAGLLGIGAVFRSNMKDANDFASSVAKAAGSTPQAQLVALKGKLHDLQDELKGQTHLGPLWLSDSAAKKANDVDALNKKIKDLQSSVDGEKASSVQAADAMSEFGQAVDGTTEDAAKAAKSLQSLQQDATGFVNAQKAEKDAAAGIVSAQQSVNAAHTKLSTLLRTNAVDTKAVAQASRDLTGAQKAAANAQDQLTAAKKAFDDLVKGPSARDAGDANMKVAQTTDDITKAQINLRDKQQKLVDLQGAAGTTADDLTSAQLDVHDATRQVTEAQESQADAQQALNDLMAAGTPGSGQYAQAQKGVADAQDAVDQANQAVADSTDKLATAQKGDLTLTQQIADAKSAVAGAQKQLADQQDSYGAAVLSEHDATDKLKTTLQDSGQAALDLRTELQGIIDQSPDLANNPFFQSLQSVLAPVAAQQDAKVRVGRAHRAGGPGSAGELFPVNEDGTELFRPNVGGEVIPLGGASGGGGQNVTVTLNVNGAYMADPATARAFADRIVPQVVGALNKQARRGTNMAAALRTN